MEDKIFYSPEEFRRLLGCSRGVCYEAIRQGKIRCFRFNRRIFIPDSEKERLRRLADAENHDAPNGDTPNGDASNDSPDFW